MATTIHRHVSRNGRARLVRGKVAIAYIGKSSTVSKAHRDEIDPEDIAFYNTVIHTILSANAFVRSHNSNSLFATRSGAL